MWSPQLWSPQVSSDPQTTHKAPILHSNKQDGIYLVYTLTATSSFTFKVSFHFVSNHNICNISVLLTNMYLFQLVFKLCYHYLWSLIFRICSVRFSFLSLYFVMIMFMYSLFVYTLYMCCS